MVDITYTDANGRRHDLRTSNAKDAISRLSRIPGYVDRKSDDLTESLGTSLKERRKQRAADFANGGVNQSGIQQSVAKPGIGATTVIPGFGGNITENGVVVGAKIFDIKVENGLIVGTSGMREERYEKVDYRKQWQEWFTDYWDGWFGRWWSSNWRGYAHWL